MPDIAYDRPVFLYVHELDELGESSDGVCEFRGCFLVLVNIALQVGEVLAITVVAIRVNERSPGPALISIEALRFKEGIINIIELRRVREDLVPLFPVPRENIKRHVFCRNVRPRHHLEDASHLILPSSAQLSTRW